jgi:hypothetical protein
MGDGAPSEQAAQRLLLHVQPRLVVRRAAAGYAQVAPVEAQDPGSTRAAGVAEQRLGARPEGGHVRVRPQCRRVVVGLEREETSSGRCRRRSARCQRSARRGSSASGKSIRASSVRSTGPPARARRAVSASALGLSRRGSWTPFRRTAGSPSRQSIVGTAWHGASRRPSVQVRRGGTGCAARREAFARARRGRSVRESCRPGACPVWSAPIPGGTGPPRAGGSDGGLP